MDGFEFGKTLHQDSRFSGRVVGVPDTRALLEHAKAAAALVKKIADGQCVAGPRLNRFAVDAKKLDPRANRRLGRVLQSHAGHLGKGRAFAVELAERVFQNLKQQAARNFQLHHRIFVGQNHQGATASEGAFGDDPVDANRAASHQSYVGLARVAHGVGHQVAEVGFAGAAAAAASFQLHFRNRQLLIHQLAQLAVELLDLLGDSRIGGHRFAHRDSVPVEFGDFVLGLGVGDIHFAKDTRV